MIFHKTNINITTNKFNKLVSQWKEETAGLSSPRAISQHPCYIEIIKMGENVLPLIFNDLQNNGGWWYPALRTITGVNPAFDCERGNIVSNTNKWLEWGIKNGYIQN